MNREQVKADILKYIREKDHVSYAEIEQIFEQDGYPYKGEGVICSPANDMVVFWQGWNSDAANIIGELKQEGKVFQQPTSAFPYWVEGHYLKIPLVRKAYPYKTEHWLPLVFRPIT